MRNPVKALLLPLGLALLLSCDQDITGSKDQPLVDYVLVVTDSATLAPLDSVRVRVTTATRDTATYFTDALEGRVQLATVASSRTLFEFSRKDYRATYLIDTISGPVDSVFRRPMSRILRIKMVGSGLNPSNRLQLNVFLRDEDLGRLRKGKITFTDSSGVERVATDNDSDGIIGLTGMKTGPNRIKVEHPGFMGRLQDVPVERLADTSRQVPATTVSLLALKYSLSGQVFYKTASGAKPLADALIEYRPKDSLYVPKRIPGLTSVKAGSEGRFTLGPLPPLDGEVWFYKDKTSIKPSLIKAILKEEVILDAPKATVVLTLSADSLKPTLLSGPKDTLNAKDTLAFKFNQAVDQVDNLTVRLINSSILLIGSALSADKTTLKVWQKEAGWQPGRKYDYELKLRNYAGDFFTMPGDSQTVIKGLFSIRDTAKVDTALIFPKDFALPLFNSGGYGGFDASDTNTSPKADSTSQFARLKWKWPAGPGRKVDSLQIWYKDGGITATNWELWSAIPASADSATLNFSDHYSTSRDANQNPDFPLRKSVDARIYLRIIPKQGAKTFSETTLDPIQQGMGPTVYVQYIRPDSLNTGTGDKDSIEVVFLAKAFDGTTAQDWETSNRPIPKLYFNDKLIARDTLEWRWKDNKTGRLIYTLPNVLGPKSYLRVDLNDALFQGKPIWQRNRKNQLALP